MTDKFEPGSLRSVRMINFMKHSNLCIDLTPHVNFITGRNGSGKSSILVAISVGLGCSSRLSGRGSNLADLIKDGQNKAIITIVIQNGPEGYNYNVYGDTITIKRSITHSSTSFELEGFKRGNQTLIKEEINRILNYFNIQIDNPCSIMHQDTAREFIGTSTPRKKYDLFMRGTLLSKLSEEIQEIKTNIKTVETQKNQRLQEKEDLDKEFEKQSHLYQIVQEADSIHQRIHDLEDELAWSHYYNAKGEAEEAGRKVEEIKQRLQEKMGSIEELKAAKEETQKAYEESEQTMREARLKINQIKGEIDRLSSVIAPVKAEISQTKGLRDRRMNSIKALESEIKSKEKKLEKKMAERDRALQDAERKRRTYIETKETELHNLEPEIADLDAKIREVSAQCKELQQQEHSLDTTLREYDSRVRSTRERYESLKRSSTTDRTTQNNYGRGYVFKPIGPLLNYIHMKDGYDSWSVAAQHIIGKALEYMYIVSCRQDMEILRRTNPNASIVITNFTTPRYNIGNPGAPCPNAVRIIDTLKFKEEVINGHVKGQEYNVRSSDIIFNVIVDQFNAERIWCVENELDAREAAFKGRANCTITKIGVQYKIQSGIEVRLGAKTKTSKIGIDYSERIAELENELRSHEEEYRRVRVDFDALTNQLRQSKMEKSSYERQLSTKNQKMNRLRAELQNPPQGEVEVDDIITEIREQIQYATNRRKEESDGLEQANAKLESLKVKREELSKQITETKGKLSESEINKTSNDQLFRDMKQAERKLNNFQNEIDQMNGKIKVFEKDYTTKSEAATSIYAKAKKHSPTKETFFSDEKPPRSIGQVSSLLKDERRKYEEAQKTHNLDFNKVRELYNKRKHDVQHAEVYLRDLQDFINHSQEALARREQKLEEMRHSIVRRTKVSFCTYQHKRSYNGKLHFNHTDHVIDIAVRQKTDNEFTDVSNLSGGEKSFCLVSLLMSLWEVMECPFYCIDEFDVFMDDINRQAATSLLVSGAKQMNVRQFIFITPLSLDHLKSAGDDVSIFEVDSGAPRN